MAPGEALQVFLHDLKQVLEQAMTGLDVTAKEKLLLHQFVAGLPAPISKQLRAVPLRGGGGGGGGGGGKGVHYPGPRGTKGAPRSLRIFFPIVCDDPFVFDRALNLSLTATVSLY